MCLPLLLTLSSAALFSPHEEKAFVAFMKEHNIIYTGNDYHLRLGIFVTNTRRVSEFNRAGLSFKVGINKFSCFTPAECRALLGVRGLPPPVTHTVTAAKTGTAPDAIDWREKNAVNPIRDQGGCGSCWAFSAIAAQESMWAINKGVLQKLSECDLVECCKDCSGCDGGWPHAAYSWKIDNQDGLYMLLSDYPYNPICHGCLFDKTKGVQKITGYVAVEEGNEEDLKEKVGTLGPVSICVDALEWSFIAYTSGIYDEPHCDPTLLNHAIAVVGYGTENGIDFWIVRNSWGLGWGEQGYIRMIRNKNNQCGVATKAVVPTAY